LKTLPDLFGQVAPLDPLYIAFLWAVDQELRGQDGYVGIIPFGSQTKGYADPDLSDFDLIVIGPESEETHLCVANIARKFWRTGHVCHCFSLNYFESNICNRKSSYASSIWHLAFPFIGNINEWNRLQSFFRERHAEAVRLNRARADETLYSAAYYVTLHETGALVDLEDGIVSDIRVDQHHHTTRKIMGRKNMGLMAFQELCGKRALMWVEELRRLAEG